MNNFVAYEQELLTNSWNRCWGNIFQTPNDELRDFIIWKYCDPRRKYHNISHLIGCISIFRSVNYLTNDPSLLELAIWIHDLENEPLSKNNERHSIDIFLKNCTIYKSIQYITNFNDVRNKLIELVMATNHKNSFEFGTQDQKLICDIDLVTLGSMDDEFKSYCQKIRQEYFMVPDTDYYHNRLSLLTYFLTRGFIYRTPYFIELCEEVAIKNLTNEINRIKIILDEK